jgi:hypothetical protein
LCYIIYFFYKYKNRIETSVVEQLIKNQEQIKKENKEKTIKYINSLRKKIVDKLSTDGSVIFTFPVYIDFNNEIKSFIMETSNSFPNSLIYYDRFYQYDNIESWIQIKPNAKYSNLEKMKILFNSFMMWIFQDSLPSSPRRFKIVLLNCDLENDNT